jgi:putative ABC transport system ATP-binding protein
MVTHDVRAAVRATRLIYIEDGTVSGEMTMPPFEADKEKSRETQVNSWLSSMQW